MQLKVEEPRLLKLPNSSFCLKLCIAPRLVVMLVLMEEAEVVFGRFLHNLRTTIYMHDVNGHSI